MVIECYRYSVLASSPDFVENDLVRDKRKLQVDWRRNIGEHPLNIYVCKTLRNRNSEFLIVGERNLFYFTEFGDICQQKKFSN